MGAVYSIPAPSCTKRESSDKLGDNLLSEGGSQTADEDTGRTGSGRKQSTVERKELRAYTDERTASMAAQAQNSPPPGRKGSTVERKALRAYTDERTANMAAQTQNSPPAGRKQSTAERKALRAYTDERTASMAAQKPKKSAMLERASTFMNVFGRGADDPEPEPEPEPEPVKQNCFARCCESKKAHVFEDQ